VEQRVNVKFCVKLGKSATESYDLLKKVYGDECLSRNQVFEWFKGFKEGIEEIRDDQRPSRPSTSKTDADIEKAGETVRRNRRLSIRAVAEIINTDKETVRQILRYNFNMKIVCSKMVPRLPTPEQKEIRMNICVDILQNIENDPNFLENVITCDKSWFSQYDPESKRQSMHWKSPSSPRQKRERQSKSKFKALMTFLSDIRGIVHVDWVPEGQTVNQVYYKEFMTNLRDRMRRKRPEMWKNGSWVLHQDNAPAHNALSVKVFLTKHKIIVLEHPPYSPDLAPCDFFLFVKIKSALKGNSFEPVDSVKAKATELMEKLSEDDLQHSFQQWKICREWCRDRGGEYIEGDISVV